MPSTTPSRNQAERADLTRSRILDAALHEFSLHGLAGARTDQIASAAGVNKALLYYYFESKEKLYIAALERAASSVRDTNMAVFLSDSSPGERILRTALAHFDRILSQGAFQRILQQEMVRIKEGESGALPLIVKRVFSPMYAMYQALIREGIASGELIDVDWQQIQLVSAGANVFYFLSAPVYRIIHSTDPLAPEALEARRKASVEFLGQALFVDRARGAVIAARVLADTPIPEMKIDPTTFEVNHERTK